MTDSANPEDFLPFLNWVGFKNGDNCKRRQRLVGEMDEFITELLEERRKGRGGEKSGLEPAAAATELDSLLSMQETKGEGCSYLFIKGMTQVFISFALYRVHVRTTRTQL